MCTVATSHLSATLAARYGASSGTHGACRQRREKVRAHRGDRPQPVVREDQWDGWAMGLRAQGTTWLFSQAPLYDDSRADGNRSTIALARAGRAIARSGRLPSRGRRHRHDRAGEVQAACRHGRPGVRAFASPDGQRRQGAGGRRSIGRAQHRHPRTGRRLESQRPLRCRSVLRARPSARESVAGQWRGHPIDNADPETSLDLQTTAAVAPKAEIHLIQIC